MARRFFILYFFPTRSFTAIRGLFLFTSPSHVARFVVSIVVRVAVKTVLWCGLASQFIQKVWKGFKAKLDTATAVICKSVIVGIITSVSGRAIGLIFRGYADSTTLSVDSLSFAGDRSPKTTTRGGMSVWQITAGDEAKRSASAQTFPYCTPTSASIGKSFNCQKAKSLAGQIPKIEVGWFGLKFNVRILQGHIISYKGNLIRLAESFTRICEPFLLYQNYA